ncbi:hypothetical protein G6F57_016579 [Rhizopus arrhizus]|uniref:Uncharacterized protein n=1 Tax=Rhizopus oryzae TaxID=64495 RepID=A0A9P6WSL7_RHIOR|nr:hypothetical protein G6F24_017689 [Rhizopus arrhizus]KAG1250606.1 hypothetical protein G6F65_018674 [Rhizopus arrhizus]KAG1274357.1 hypothetical protein G6F64_015149 [Rhizopus arrhizus]KAG1449620.1 hypothetical protein G6F57_016579 [Rhizopus arrhizus]
MRREDRQLPAHHAGLELYGQAVSAQRRNPERQVALSGPQAAALTLSSVAQPMPAPAFVQHGRGYTGPSAGHGLAT